MTTLYETLPPPPPPAAKSHALRNTGIGIAATLLAMTLIGAVAGSNDTKEALASTTPTSAAPPSTAHTRAPAATAPPDVEAENEWWYSTGQAAMDDVQVKLEAISSVEGYDFDGMTEACIDLSVAALALQTAPDTEFGQHMNAAGAAYYEAGDACARLDPDAFEADLTLGNAELAKAVDAL
jgi:hypothetical protein